MNSKKFFFGMLVGLLSCCAVIAAFIIVIDPYFQYHEPFEGMYYRLGDERYVNAGIVKNFDYDAMITGTSMAENFKTSEAEELFGMPFVKVPLEGASYKEINGIIELGLENNPDVKMVIRAVDISGLGTDKDLRNYTDDTWPGYLYDKNYFNDLEYLLNKEIIKEAYSNLQKSLQGWTSTSFDDYANWNDESTFGKEEILAYYDRPEKVNEGSFLSEEEKKMIEENVRQNVTAIAEKYPEVEFYYFIPPYSIVYWDRENQKGTLERQIESQRILIEEMLKYSNIKIFGFSNSVEIITELDNYKDIAHYGEDINSELLRLMSRDECLITSGNYEAYIECLYEVFANYDYDSIFAN